MAFGKIHSYEGNVRDLKAMIAAKYNKVDVTLNKTKLGTLICF
jgi:hypothetical protein